MDDDKEKEIRRLTVNEWLEIFGELFGQEWVEELRNELNKG